MSKGQYYFSFDTEKLFIRPINEDDAALLLCALNFKNNNR